jgi:hypothetical protein
MARLRRIGWLGFTLGLVALGVGVLLAGGSAVVAGDWWLAPMPWIDWGIKSLVVGMAITAASAIVLVVVEPIGWLRLLAVPPALLMFAIWVFILLVGFPVTHRSPFVRPDVVTQVVTSLYSVPVVLVLAMLTTLLIALPLLVARLRAPRLFTAR